MRSKKGFTLIELLVVFSIIAVLAGLLIPGVLRAMKQAKTNRALSEMQHLATVISQVYNDVGYYARLEDLAKTDSSQVRIWTSDNDYVNGRSDDDLVATDSLALQPTGSMWNGVYTTYKSYATIPSGLRPIDPWGTMGNSDADQHQYRMFVIKNTGPAAAWVPGGATAAMVIISAGPDKVYESNISGSKTPVNAAVSDFNTFTPNTLDPTDLNRPNDDVYFIFNAGIQ